MSTRRVVACLDAPPAREEDLLEWLRVVAALAACARPVELLATPTGAPALTEDAAGEEVLRILDLLGEVGVRPEVVPAAALGARLVGAAGVLRLGAAARAGRPELLVVVPPTLEPADWQEAGQVLLRAAAPPTPPRE